MNIRNMAILIAIASVIGLSGCNRSDSHSRAGHSYHAPSASAQRQAREQRHANRGQMIRQVNGIVENIEQADRRLRSKLDVLEAEQRQLDRLKEDAKTAYIAGQVADYRTWQRIARDKYANVRAELVRAENTVAAVRNDASNQLRRVSWVSGADRRRHQGQIDQKLSQLARWDREIRTTAANVTSHEKWLNADL